MTTLSKSILYQEDIQKIKPNLQAVKFLWKSIAEKTQAIVFQKEKNRLSILTTNNFPEDFQDLKMKIEAKGYILDIYYTTTDGFYDAMGWYQQIEDLEAKQKKDFTKTQTAEGKSALKMIQKLYEKKVGMDAGEFILELIRLAFQTWASDLHFQTENKKVIARIRIDGVLQNIVEFTVQEFEKYMQKIKFISGVKMNIGSLPQDGRFSFSATNPIWEQRKIDARVNFMPGMTSESVVIRFLDPIKGLKTLGEVGFEGQNYETIKKYLNLSGGIVIFTGPTGSWKTTSLYSILNEMNTGKEKIITLEDPVEYELGGIQQSQINKAKGYTFEEGLHAILRQDPDVILVWETRSKETAEIAINAAITGHKVFSTLHTDSAITAISRLMNMGVKAYMLAPALQLVVSQRLVRKVCPHCAGKKTVNYAEKQRIQEVIQRRQNVDPSFQPNISFDQDIELVQWVGCDECNHTGYQWRIAILELFEVSDTVTKMILDGANMTEIYTQARSEWYLTMEEDGILKVLNWKTTLDELRRVL